jgi:hypothetical protein
MEQDERFIQREGTTTDVPAIPSKKHQTSSNEGTQRIKDTGGIFENRMEVDDQRLVDGPS